MHRFHFRLRLASPPDGGSDCILLEPSQEQEGPASHEVRQAGHFLCHPERVREKGGAVTKYLISFPSAAMVVPDGDWGAVADAAHAVIQEARDAGVYIFSGGIDEDVAPVRVAGDGNVTDGSYPQTAELDGGFAILDLPSREDALEWAAKLAVACRCAQEVRAFQDDPLA